MLFRSHVDVELSAKMTDSVNTFLRANPSKGSPGISRLWDPPTLPAQKVKRSEGQPLAVPKPVRQLLLEQDQRNEITVRLEKNCSNGLFQTYSP